MIVRKSIINERVTFNEKVDEIFRGEVAHLRSKVFNKLDDDELQYFMGKLKDWTLDMLGEKPEYKEEPMKDWGGPGSTDFKPGWGEMGG